ncbi:MAG: carbohydrate ABC transporter substrate-binding protein [Clostridia bacterium]|nr:carbohydrate ABC transporter substrate-binding protein [Clostridia bacterium]
MKVKRLLATVLILIMMMNQLAACSLNPAKSDSPSGETSDEISEETTKEIDSDDLSTNELSISKETIKFVRGVTDAKSTFNGKTLIFNAAETWGHPYNNRMILYPWLKEQYGLKVVAKPSVYLRDTLQNVQETKARMQIDLIGVSHNNMPSVYSTMRPLNSKINLDYAPKGLDQSTMNATRKGNDIMYLPQLGSEGIAYNVEKFKKAGLEEPYDLQLKGQWTWDKFAEYAKFFTEDNNKNGKPEKWGFGSWDRTFHEFALTNNANYYTYNTDGTVTSKISTRAVTKSMEFVKELYSKKAIYLFGGLGNYPEFYNDESIAMIKMDIPHNPKDLVYGMVAMPKGPDKGSENIVTTLGTGYGLPTDMVEESNEKAALLFLAVMLDFNRENNMKRMKEAYDLNPRWEEMYETVYGGKTPTKMLVLYGVENSETKISSINSAIKDDSKSVMKTVQELEGKSNKKPEVTKLPETR